MYGNNRGDNFHSGTLGPGTTILSNAPATLKRVYWGGTYVGTLDVYDSKTVAGTSLTNQVLSIGIPLLRYPFSFEVNVRCNDGIIVTETGTPTHKVVWGE